MADLKTTELDALAVRDDADLIMVVDTSDTSMAASGTNKYMTTANFLSGVSGTPGGSDTQIQFNDDGSFGGDADLTWDDTNNVLIVGASSGGGILVQGTYNSGWVIPNATGTRMFFNPRKAAFRAGYTSGTQWNDAYVGAYSTAFGYNTAASGIYSISIGFNTVASATGSVAIGCTTTATANYSFALGHYATTYGQYSTAFGYYVTTSGLRSTALGAFAYAKNYGEIASANTYFNTYGDCDRSNISLSKITYSDIPVLLETGPGNVYYLYPNETCIFEVDCLAVSIITGEVAAWKLLVIQQSNSSGISTIISIRDMVASDVSGANGSLKTYAAGSNIYANVCDESAGAWYMKINSGYDCISISIVGEAATTIYWHANLNITKVTIQTD